MYKSSLILHDNYLEVAVHVALWHCGTVCVHVRAGEVASGWSSGHMEGVEGSEQYTPLLR